MSADRHRTRTSTVTRRLAMSEASREAATLMVATQDSPSSGRRAHKIGLLLELATSTSVRVALEVAARRSNARFKGCENGRMARRRRKSMWGLQASCDACDGVNDPSSGDTKTTCQSESTRIAGFQRTRREAQSDSV